jgi:hypothetical protein
LRHDRRLPAQSTAQSTASAATSRPNAHCYRQRDWCMKKSRTAKWENE